MTGLLEKPGVTGESQLSGVTSLVVTPPVLFDVGSSRWWSDNSPA